jgi:hypothetical protein
MRHGAQPAVARVLSGGVLRRLCQRRFQRAADVDQARRRRLHQRRRAHEGARIFFLAQVADHANVGVAPRAAGGP